MHHWHQQVASQQQKLNALPVSKLTEEIRPLYEKAAGALTQAAERVQTAEFVVDQTKGRLDRKEQKLLKEIFGILKDCLSDESFAAARKALLERFGTKEG